MNSLRAQLRRRRPLAAGMILVLVVAVGAVFALRGHAAGHGGAAGAAGAGTHGRSYAKEAPDPLEAESYPQSAGAPAHAKARAPRKAALEAFISPGGASNAQIQAELSQEQAALSQVTQPGGATRATIDPVSGDATPTPGLPLRIEEVIAGGNAIADFPYRYGGGHVSFIDDAYDCSGSVSYALAAGGLINAPETSGQLESWGAPGPGRYLTVFATNGHTFMWVDGIWFDTAGRAGPYSTRWLTAQPPLTGFVVRHYPGL
jgi:hypothetical protein